MIAISTAEFWQKLEGRERDLLQKRITELQGNMATSQINFNTRSLILAGVSVLFIAVTAYLQYQDKTAQRVQELQQTVQNQSEQLRNIRTSVEALNSSIQSLKIDTPISIRIKKQ